MKFLRVFNGGIDEGIFPDAVCFGWNFCSQIDSCNWDACGQGKDSCNEDYCNIDACVEGPDFCNIDNCGVDCGAGCPG